MERLQKIIAQSGICSRRKAEELILEGRVKVNGEIIKELGTKVSATDVISVDDKKIRVELKEYYLLNKPRGIVCTTKDEHERKTVCELIDTKTRIYPVGRLDYDTTGLILLTNDGKLANILMHPSYGVEKTYLAKIKGNLSMKELHELKDGILIENTLCKATRVKIKKRDLEKQTENIEITIKEGRNHIVKRLFESIHHDVLKLTRIKYGHLTIGGMKSGEYLILPPEEIKKFYELKK